MWILILTLSLGPSHGLGSSFKIIFFDSSRTIDIECSKHFLINEVARELIPHFSLSVGHALALWKLLLVNLIRGKVIRHLVMHAWLLLKILHLLAILIFLLLFTLILCWLIIFILVFHLGSIFINTIFIIAGILMIFWDIFILLLMVWLFGNRRLLIVLFNWIHSNEL